VAVQRRTASFTSPTNVEPTKQRTENVVANLRSNGMLQITSAARSSTSARSPAGRTRRAVPTQTRRSHHGSRCARWRAAKRSTETFNLYQTCQRGNRQACRVCCSAEGGVQKRSAAEKRYAVGNVRGRGWTGEPAMSTQEEVSQGFMFVAAGLASARRR